ncbi:MAG TPA: response regulator [Aliidongia sp.]|uniref:response regulator n=1 Tax=Aliidongia sp. TaxID=1914230 RepID=UPI002DDCC364|nr:response regulator [Aliidongia sp.]HEV2673075.1 response regulator [Aliidongia sp.]
MERTPHILVVDDDREICSLVSQFLSKHGLRVSTARDGGEMMRALEVSRIDLVVLDLMLPGEDGLSLCRKLRAQGSIPVIMLTAMSEEIDRILGLEMGADDYLAKPFNPRELLARVRAVLRRVGALPAPTAEINAGGRILSFDGWRLDLAKRELRNRTGEIVLLSSGEFDLIQAFAERPQRVLTRDQLLDLARGRAAVLYDRSVDIQVMRLRRKIEQNPKDPQLIKTVRSGGYMFTPPVQVIGQD